MIEDFRPAPTSSATASVPVTTLTTETVETIRQHAVETFPDECCGALIEIDGVVREAYRMDNTTAGPAARRFRIGPDGYRLADKRAREVGGSLLGFYHSHPNAPARPSEYDLAHAWPNLTYVIISVPAGAPGEITAWHLRDNRSGFIQGETRES
jgi:proteasome lid subunit RPN8/RPN11